MPAYNVIEHVRSHDVLLLEADRVMKPGRKIVVVVGDKDNISEKLLIRDGASLFEVSGKRLRELMGRYVRNIKIEERISTIKGPYLVKKFL